MVSLHLHHSNQFIFNDDDGDDGGGNDDPSFLAVCPLLTVVNPVVHRAVESESPECGFWPRVGVSLFEEFLSSHP